MTKLPALQAAFQIARQATLEATQRALVETAKREHAKIMATSPRPGSFTRFVDGRQGAAEETVMANGVITYEYHRLDAVAQFALEALFDMSPVDSGEYRAAHTLFLRDRAVSDLKGWQPGDSVFISNFVPYARMIENGKMKMRVSGTAEVYARASVVVHRRFGNVADVGMTWIGILNGIQGRSRKFNQSDERFPALQILGR